MRSKMKLSAVREIKSSFGRYMAILAIIALGVGFFSGVRITTPTMIYNMNGFLQEHKLFDYRLLSTLGWEQEDIDEMAKKPDVRAVEGAYTADILCTDNTGDRDFVFKAHSLTKELNTVKLSSGRMPEAPDECLLDVKLDVMGSSEKMGIKTISLKDGNEQDTVDMLRYKEFKVVGYCYSPIYIHFERGTTSLGTGSVSGFVYFQPEAFDSEVFSEVYVRFDEDEEIYSDEYKEYMDAHEDVWEDIAQERADARYERLYTEADDEITDGENELEDSRREGQQKLDDAKAELEDARKTLDETKEKLDKAKSGIDSGREDIKKIREQYGSAADAMVKPQEEELDKAEKEYKKGLEEYEKGETDYEDGLAEYAENEEKFNTEIADAEAELEDAREELSKLKKPETFLLDRGTNIGCACFENDSQIVAQVARIFPIFFILVAALVCMTTMSRMVEEQRTQIGVFKALGYSNAAIMGRLLFYSGSAAVIGAAAGYTIGTILFPRVIWMTYQLMYIPLTMEYMFDTELAVISGAVSLICSVGTTWVSCRYELGETAASLMRPKAPKAGKRVLLERIPFIWNRMRFLVKVSVRNIFRYKKRFFMMIVGISGCTALLLTGFGLKDSVAGFADVQYGEVFLTDASMTYEPKDGEIPDEVKTLLDEHTGGYKIKRESAWDLVTDKKTKSITLEAPENYDQMDDFVRINDLSGNRIPAPKSGEAIVSQSLEERFDVHKGDTITLRDEKLNELKLKVIGVFENHVYHYVFTNIDTFKDQLGEAGEFNGAYLNFEEGADEYKESAAIAGSKDVKSISVYSEMRERMSKTMKSLDYVVLLIIVSAAGLAFIVIYNLTNINITERLREIATIKVLGFFRHETSAYVLRENIALTALGTAVGLGLGILLHRFVMQQIVVDMVSFRVRILPMSYVYSIVFTFIFNFLVDLVMETKLERINMAESLKSVD